jgi:hypothetical protein
VGRSSIGRALDCESGGAGSSPVDPTTVEIQIWNLVTTMKTYTCTSFTGFCPVGTAAVVRAENAEEAAEMLNEELVVLGLPGDATPDEMRHVTAKGVYILRDGDY